MNALIPALAALLSAAAPQPDEVLVIGARTKDDALVTLLADAHGLTKAGDGIAVPRNTGWWVLQFADSGTKVHLHTLMLAPAGPDGNALSQNEELGSDCLEGEHKQVLLFAGPKFFAVEDSSWGMYEGAAHPFANTGLLAISMDTMKAVPITEALGAAAGPMLEKAGDKVRGGADARRDACLNEPDTSNWAIVRSRGKWQVRGGLGYAAEMCRGNHEYYDVDAPVPGAIASAGLPAVSWDALKKSHPGLLDAVPSPSGALTLLIFKDRLELLTGAKTLATMPGNFAVVLAEAAKGKAAERWRKQVVEALAPPTEPE